MNDLDDFYGGQPLGPEPVRAAKLDPATALCVCGFLLAEHFGPLTQGQGGYEGTWYGSEDCWGGPGVPGSREALEATYGTADPDGLTTEWDCGTRMVLALPEDMDSALLERAHRETVVTGAATVVTAVTMALITGGAL